MDCNPRLLEAIFDGSADGILVVDQGGSVQTANPAAERLLGYAVGELCEAELAKLIPIPFANSPSSAAFAPLAVGAAGTTAANSNYEAQGRHKSGRTIPLAISTAPIIVEGRMWLVATIRDLTVRKVREARNVQNQRLAAIRELSSGLAHESRNALQRSQSCLELLAFETQDRPKALELIDRIQQAQDHLLELYEEIRSYAAPMTLETTRVALDEIVRQSWNDVLSGQSDHRPQLELQSSVSDLFCEADRDRLGQMFRAILKNAIEAAGLTGVVDVQCSESEIDGEPAITVSIRDPGPGVSPHLVSKLFLPFFTTKMRGMGLGLAISKRIAEAHGGRVVFVSQSEPGARFDITLPRRQLGE